MSGSAPARAAESAADWSSVWVSTRCAMSMLKASMPQSGTIRRAVSGTTAPRRTLAGGDFMGSYSERKGPWDQCVRACLGPGDGEAVGTVCPAPPAAGWGLILSHHDQGLGLD